MLETESTTQNIRVRPKDRVTMSIGAGVDGIQKGKSISMDDGEKWQNEDDKRPG